MTGQALDHYGAVEAGKAADLVLLDRNPLKDIAATRATRAAVLRRQNRWKGPTMDDSEYFLTEAIALARANADHGGRPFGAVVVKDGAVIASGVNEMLATGDPTAHAELGALRAASRALGSPDLSGCAVFASGHPCPMCMAAMRLSGIGAVTYAYSNEDGAPYGLSTAAIYADLAKPFAEQAMHIRHVPQGEPELYADWARKQQAKER